MTVLRDMEVLEVSHKYNLSPKPVERVHWEVKQTERNLYSRGL